MNALQDFQELNKQRSGEDKRKAAFVAEEFFLCWIQATQEALKDALGCAGGDIVSAVVSFKPTLPASSG